MLKIKALIICNHLIILARENAYTRRSANHRGSSVVRCNDRAAGGATNKIKKPLI
jgi:hypothetical protein